MTRDVVQVRVREGQKVAWEMAAGRHGVGLSEWIRGVLDQACSEDIAEAFDGDGAMPGIFEQVVVAPVFESVQVGGSEVKQRGGRIFHEPRSHPFLQEKTAVPVQRTGKRVLCSHCKWLVDLKGRAPVEGCLECRWE